MDGTPAIDARGVRVRYGAAVVIRGLDLQVPFGESLSIVGRSGCGKTSLLMALAGFVPHEGTIAARQGIGVVFQSYAIYPWLTVRGNIAFGLDRWPRTKVDEQVARCLKLTGLTDHADKYPAQLSGGQAQRVAIARTLAPEPDILLLDEPLGALDLVTRDEMMLWLQHLLDSTRKTCVQVTHSIDEAVWLSDRVLVMAGGRFVAEFRVPFNRPRDEALRFSEAFIDLKRQIHESLRSHA